MSEKVENINDQGCHKKFYMELETPTRRLDERDVRNQDGMDGMFSGKLSKGFSGLEGVC